MKRSPSRVGKLVNIGDEFGIRIVCMYYERRSLFEKTKYELYMDLFLCGPNHE
jgi:hypothetical protein